MLHKCDWFSHSYQVSALAYLLIVKRYASAEKALETIAGLSSDETAAISMGLERADVEGAQKNIIETLILLKEWGLTRQHLDKIDQFNEEHARALSYLMKTEFLSADATIEAIQSLEDKQDNELAELRLTVILDRCLKKIGTWSTLKNDIVDLDRHQLFYLRNNPVRERLQIEDVRGLTELQLIARVKFSYKKGINELIRSEMWINTIKTAQDLENLTIIVWKGRRTMDIDAAIKSLFGLNQRQVDAFILNL